ncbi:bifunctional enoyl-CoA hydratase/phosphate acetyltransferase [Vagococcus sp. BWB3-3]|uniref:Bifunctional enoyl-CoA hydratase/phosphate acetyltransferase n=1 Tax=Vagococcus allomyrinae TaxID=2794353 RepID=A0A940SXL2_9ENTE|nr:bifunctional enoyl-CoA hydratase/phosphate acetyltransferase [Vagococcus allomyrinae]MBP1044445.1 bifunctional enoyl-CoA hydratase/phosphate acetyltransferase [Vagococcus allomyrinae]
MITNFDEMVIAAKRPVKPKIAVAVAQDRKVLAAVKLADDIGLASSILIGDQKKIEELAKVVGLNLKRHEMINCENNRESCQKAVDLINSGQADLPMKGIVETSVMLKAVLDKERGLRSGTLLSHVGVFVLERFPRLLILSDSAMTILPNVEEKAVIIENALEVALALGINQPKITLVCATETVNPKMPATVEAAELVRMNREQQRFSPGVLAGPLGLDNAISEEAARVKGITDPIAGQADILIMPNIEAGNILNKSLEYFAQAEKSGVIMGAREPIILTSRASSDLAKLQSMALALLIQQNQKARK